MKSNLPPDVSEHDIPGNRPEDGLYEKLFEKLPEEVQFEIENETEVGKELDKEFEKMLKRIFTENDVIQEMIYILTELRT